MKSRRTSLLLSGAVLAALVSAASVSSQTLISSVTLSGISATGGTQVVGGQTFNNQTQSIQTFTAGSATYAVSGGATGAYARRNSAATSNSSPDNSSVWYATMPSGGSNNLRASYTSDYGQLLLGNNILRGSDNTFVNRPDSGTELNNTGNIERLDFVFGSAMNQNPGLAFAVFDRGDATAHDAFKIALITGWNSTTNQPTSYSTLVGMNGPWGTTNVVDTFSYTLLRYNTGNTLGSAYATQTNNNQGIGGVVFTLADFNLASGQQIYGYSLFGYDVVANSDGTAPLDWTNASYYPTTSSGASTHGAGGIDLAAVNGVLFQDITFSVIPEPSTYAAAGVLLMVCGAALRRRPRPAHTSPASA